MSVSSSPFLPAQERKETGNRFNWSVWIVKPTTIGGVTQLLAFLMIRTPIRIPASPGTHLHIAVYRRHVKTEPAFDKETGEQVGWHTKPADWYLSWGWRTRHGTTYTREGLEKEQGFKTKKEAIARKRELLNGEAAIS